MTTWVLVTVVALLIAAGIEEGAAVHVKLRQGIFKGEYLHAGSGRLVYSFRGIPYAKPPVRNLRFKDPEPLNAWDGTKESFTPPQCPQPPMEAFLNGTFVITGDEDCLYLHVYTPKLDGSALPVMVFIHGGGFISGNPDVVGGTPLPLLTRDVVLVSLQYRLGILGFLSTEDDVLPGNLGLKDQALALRWVHDNIHTLGGDPSKVTVFGQSAGAASAHLHMMTPQTKGLFQRVIMHSGNALCPWALRSDHKRVAAAIGRRIGCDGVEDKNGSLNSLALLTCLREMPHDTLVLEASRELDRWAVFPFYMVPRVDGNYLPAHPARLLREGRYHKVDIISGVCRHECYLCAWVNVATPEGPRVLDQFSTLGPITVGMDEEQNGDYLARRIYYHYLGSGNIRFTEQKLKQLVQMYSDVYHMIPHDLSAQMHAGHTAHDKGAYLYQLDHAGDQSVFSAMFNINRKKHWVGHNDDLLYLFNDTFEAKPLQRPDDLFFRQIMLDLWTNFAATGNPTPDFSLGFKWSPASPSNLQYLSLKPAAAMHSDQRAEARAFFSDLPTKQNMLLFPDKFGAFCPALKDQQ